MLSLNVTVIAGDCWYIEFYPELANFTTVSVVDQLIRQKRGDNVCVVNRIKIVYLLISDDERNENPWPALWTESQAREFKNRHPWLEWRDSKLGRYQLLSTHENLRPKMALLVSGRN